jgi:hypothetical protein
MVNTRSGAGQDIPPVIHAHIVSQLNQGPPPPQELAMDPMMQQLFTEQMQLIQNLTATVQNLQTQQNQPPPQCHTRFSEENQMHLICAPGSSLHTYDGRHE